MSEIKISGLTKHYGDVCALNDVSLSLGGGKIYALLGKNGAGKSTLLSIMTNRIFASNGTVIIDGVSVRENDSAQNKIFCMSENGDYPQDMKVKDAFWWVRLYYPSFDTDYANKLCEKFRLEPKKRIGKLSTGYKSIYKLILTLASGADTCIFDEPALGLDASMRELFYAELLRYYNENPKTIIISTHLIEEIAKLVEHVLILKNGRLIVDDETDAFLSQGWRAQGALEDIEHFVGDKRVLKRESLGKLADVSVYAKLTAEDRRIAEESGIELTKLGMQELFVGLTQGESGRW